MHQLSKKQVLVAVLWAIGIPFPDRRFQVLARARIPLVFMGIAALLGVLPGAVAGLWENPSPTTGPVAAWDLAAMAIASLGVAVFSIVVGNAILFLWSAGILTCVSRLNGPAVDAKAASLRIIYLASCPQIGQTTAIGGLRVAASVSSPSTLWNAVFIAAMLLLVSTSLSRVMAAFWQARSEVPRGILVPALVSAGCVDCWLALWFVARWAG